MNWLLSLLHVTVNYADVTVDDTDILCRRVRILFGTLTDLYPLNEQPQEFRCQLINRFAFSMKASTFAADAFSFANRSCFTGIASSSVFCSAL